MEKTVNLPPLAFQDYSIDVHIRIYPSGSRYGADIFAMGQVRRIPIDLSAHDLADLNKQLQEEIEHTVTWFARNSDSTAKDAKEQLYPLAKLGNYAYQKIFGYRDTTDAIQNLLSRSRRALIEIASEDFFLPWELLYPVSFVGTAISYKHFWGMNHIISRIIVQNDGSAAFVPPVIPISSLPKLGLLTNNRLPAVVQTEIPFFEKLHADGKICLFRLRNLDPNPGNTQAEFEEFRDFWSNTLDLAHFACHAAYEDKHPNQLHILLSDEFPITLIDFDVYEVAIDSHPLVMLNACKTSNLNPLYTADFARKFLKLGARGVVTTECAIPDDFAAQFVQRLYIHLLAGEPLGESLLATRQYFLDKHHDPSGLLYSMYAPPSIRLVKVVE